MGGIGWSAKTNGFLTVAETEVKRTINKSGICTVEEFSLPSADCEEIFYHNNHKLKCSS